MGGAFDGIANETKLSVIKKEIQLQVREAHSTSGYIFFNIRTKKNNKKRVVAHWSFVKHPMEGDVIYGIIYLHRPENTGADFDTVTGLYGKQRFQRQIAIEAKKEAGSAQKEYAIVYLNLVNFKLLNIDRGVAEGDDCLKVMADTLTDVFDDAVISRLSDDHFAVFTGYGDVHLKTEEAERRFCETYGNYLMSQESSVYADSGRIPPLMWKQCFRRQRRPAIISNTIPGSISWNIPRA